MSLDVEALRSSFALVVDRCPTLTLRFYEILFERHPEAESLFVNNSRDQQAKMLAEALGAVLDKLEDAPWLSQTLQAMGAKHVGYGVTDAMYPWVGECLIATLAEVAQDAWTDQLEQAWTDAYGAISGLMLEGAAKASH